MSSEFATGGNLGVSSSSGADLGFLQTHLGDSEKNVQKNGNMDEFSSQLFHSPFFFYGEVTSKSEDHFIRMTMCCM